MSKLHAHIEQLAQQLRQLIVNCDEQKAQIEKLQQENEQLKQALHNQAGHYSKGINQKAIRQWLKEQPSANKENRLSHYIKTIDECIAFLETL